MDPLQMQLLSLPVSYKKVYVYVRDYIIIINTGAESLGVEGAITLPLCNLGGRASPLLVHIFNRLLLINSNK